MDGIVQAIGIGMVVMLVGTIPRNIFFAANLRYFARVPWAVPVTACDGCLLLVLLALSERCGPA